MASRDHEDPLRAAGSLPVASRRTLSGDGGVSRSEHVHCPRREGAIGVAVCLGCVDCEGVLRGPDGDALLCAVAEREPAARAATSAAATQVGLAEIMTRNVVCVRDDVSAETLAAMLMDLSITGAPVVDEHGRPVGMVSRSDLVQLQLAEEGLEADLPVERGLHAQPPSRGLVRDFMMPMTFTLPESASIAHAAALMAYESIHRVPVVATDGSVVGIVSALDILRWLAAGSGYAVPERRAFGARQRR